ncbi:hypothetical protein PsYK624_136640 [Phanerochaete sordida]|uniref:Uncharacterized protein n=1 Tax=Phanerochaete sordida TaxID=48140 RepID=A0A9P3GLE2_9APHY|nr:hypothetical protein PsYK624_136640 [Phanerochaete sordida]
MQRISPAYPYYSTIHHMPRAAIAITLEHPRRLSASQRPRLELLRFAQLSNPSRDDRTAVSGQEPVCRPFVARYEWETAPKNASCKPKLEVRAGVRCHTRAAGVRRCTARTS